MKKVELEKQEEIFISRKIKEIKRKHLMDEEVESSEGTEDVLFDKDKHTFAEY